jgi:ADP-ribosylation factor family
MFSLVSGLYAEYFSPQQINLLVVGVQGCGKTTLLERIKVTSFSSSSITAAGSTSHHSINIDDTAIAAAAAAAAVTTSVTLPPDEKHGSTSTKTHHHHHNNGSMHHAHHGNAGPTPELLRSKIFLADSLEEYQAPTKRRNAQRRRNHRPHNGTVLLTTTSSSSSHNNPPLSRFSWICPAPPKFRTSRMDTSDRSSSNHLQNVEYDDDEFSTDAFDDNNNDDHQLWEASDDDEDEDDYYHDEATDDYTDRNDDMNIAMDTTLLSATSMASARSRRSAVSTGGSHHGTIARVNSNNHGGGPIGLPAPRRITSSSSSQHDDLRKSSMESIDLGDKQRWSSSQSNEQQRRQQQPPQRSFLSDTDNAQLLPSLHYDLKPGAKMLPLERIRPTIGMNLGKTEICGAKVHVWDLGGKLHDLWERYYDDADAVLFVWRLCREDVVRQLQEQQSSQRDNDEDDAVRVTTEQQKRVLEQVRLAVPDDVPFCLLGHLFQVQPPYNCEPDVLYSTSQLLPHYHNPLQALFMANAVTGQGIKTALEWLISTAKRQQRIRKRSPEGTL